METVVKRFKSIAVSLGFSCLLVLPTFDQCLSLSSDFKSTEKRILTPYPVFQFSHIRTFIAQFTLYYSENFGWRNVLFYQYSQWKYRLLATSPLPQKVLVGKKGWFYPGNSLNHVVDQHRGIGVISPAKLSFIAYHLTQRQDELAALGTKLYILVAPDSYTIYPEYAPEYLQVESAVSNYDRLKEYIEQHTTIPIISVKDSLQKSKLQHVVYCQTDTHWNDYGSLVASLATVDRVRLDFPNMYEPCLKDYAIQARRGVGGDLVTMIALNRELVDSVSYKVTPAFFLRTQQTETRENVEMRLPSQRFVGSARRSPKLLLIGDSFSYSMNQFLPGYFRESLFIRSHHLDLEVAKAEHPDVIIFEITERDIDALGYI